MKDFLGEAAVGAFTKEQSPNVNWSKVSNPFHDSYFTPSYEDVSKLKALEEAIQNTRGCLDPEASNYDPNATEDDGSCVFVEITDQPENPLDYITKAITKLFGKLKEPAETDKPDFRIQPYSGRALTQRELKSLTHFQDIVQRAVGEAEKKVQ